MSDVGEWFATLPLVVDPAEEAARMRTGDWRQDAEYPVPLWTATAAELASRISIELVAGLVALHLPTRYDADVDRVLELGHWSRRWHYRFGGVEADRPLEQGFLRRVWLRDERGAPEQATDASAVVRAFFDAERARLPDIEPWLVARYGRDARGRHDVFRYIDYPAFDNGSLDVGFAILVHGAELHVYSRVVHFHK